MSDAPAAHETDQGTASEGDGATAVAEAPAPVAEEPTAEEQVVTEGTSSDEDARAVEKLFSFSGFVHVGPGARECEDGEDGSCGDPLHFHAWCRLPNKFQIGAIRKKAMAAKARTARRLKDEASDDYAILEDELDSMREAGKEALVEEVLSRTYWKDHMAAMKELAEDEEGEFTNIEEDQTRWKELTDMPEAERPTDEYDELTRHLDKWNSEVDRVRDENQRPQREGLEAREVDDLIDLIRNERIKAQADQEYMQVYSAEEWALCTLRPRPADKGTPNTAVFGSIEQLKEAPPEVVVALESFFAELEGEFANRAAVRAEGNS